MPTYRITSIVSERSKTHTSTTPHIGTPVDLSMNVSIYRGQGVWWRWVYMESGYGHTQPIDEPDDESTRGGVGGDEAANRAMYRGRGVGGGGYVWIEKSRKLSDIRGRAGKMSTVKIFWAFSHSINYFFEKLETTLALYTDL